MALNDTRDLLSDGKSFGNVQASLHEITLLLQANDETLETMISLAGNVPGPIVGDLNRVLTVTDDVGGVFEWVEFQNLTTFENVLTNNPNAELSNNAHIDLGIKSFSLGTDPGGNPQTQFFEIAESISDKIAVTGEIQIMDLQSASTINIAAVSQITLDSAVNIGGNYILPTVDGETDQVLVTDGAGVTSWVRKSNWNITGSVIEPIEATYRIGVPSGSKTAPGLVFKAMSDSGLFVGGTEADINMVVKGSTLFEGMNDPSKSYATITIGPETLTENESVLLVLPRLTSTNIPTAATALKGAIIWDENNASAKICTGSVWRELQTGIGAYLPLTGGILTGQVKGSDGSSAEPAYSFDNAPTTGVYLTSGNIGFTVGASAALLLESSKIRSPGTTTGKTSISLDVGSAAIPNYSFLGDENTGIFRAGTDSLGISANSSVVATFSNTGIDVQNNAIYNLPSPTSSTHPVTLGYLNNRIPALTTSGSIPYWSTAESKFIETSQLSYSGGTLTIGSSAGIGYMRLVNNQNKYLALQSAPGVTTNQSFILPDNISGSSVDDILVHKGSGSTTFKPLSTLVASTLFAVDGSSQMADSTQMKAANGSAVAPAITNKNDTNTGMYFPTADTLGFAVAGVEKWQISASYLGSKTTGAPNLKSTAPSSTAPAYSFYSDTDTGINRSGANQMQIVCGATSVFEFSSSLLTALKPIVQSISPTQSTHLANKAYVDLKSPSTGTTTGDVLYWNNVTSKWEVITGLSFTANSITIGTDSNVGSIRIKSNNTKAINLAVPESVGQDYTLTLPDLAPTADQYSYLRFDSSGNASWVQAPKVCRAAEYIVQSGTVPVANETFNIRTGIFSGGATTSRTGWYPTMFIGENTGEFRDKGDIKLFLNGVMCRKNGNVYWVDKDTIRFTVPLSINDWIHIEAEL